jgi:electron transfer flavoprotein alpha subunit
MVPDVSAVVNATTFKRPMLAGNMIATVEADGPKFVFSARQASWPAPAATAASAPIEAASVSVPSLLGAEVVSFEGTKSERPDLGDAKIVVTGGRGMKEKENFKHIEKLADVLGGAMGATRAVCDAGLVPNDLQVGQTGKIVAPNLYIAIGVSGAIQHLAGMRGSKVIVAINKDPDAPIFTVADYGLVAKWEDTLPRLIERLTAIKAAA